MSPSVANIVVQIAAEASDTISDTEAPRKKVLDGLVRLGFDEASISQTIIMAKDLGIIHERGTNLEIVGA